MKDGESNTRVNAYLKFDATTCVQVIWECIWIGYGLSNMLLLFDFRRFFSSHVDLIVIIKRMLFFFTRLVHKTYERFQSVLS